MRLAAVALAVLSACSSARHRDATGPAPTVTPVPLPGGAAGIGFDDLQYAAPVGVIVPAGRTGALDLVDPSTGAITQIQGFSADATYGGGHGDGTTSAVLARDWLLAIDRTSMQLDVVDPTARTIVAHASLAASPDYVRWIDATGEAWVTEPDGEQIEIFTVASDGTPTATATIAVAGGPESLVVSPRRGTAYAHLWKGQTVTIDVATRKVTATWTNGCEGSRGIALDDERGWLFVGCSEGKATVLDLDHDGAPLGTADTDGGVDIIAYAPALRRLYVPAAETGAMSVLAVGDDGALSASTTVFVAKGSHCVVTDGAGRVWACDPSGGRLIAITGLP